MHRMLKSVGLFHVGIDPIFDRVIQYLREMARPKIASGFSLVATWGVPRGRRGPTV
jgi:hypothetical protein